MTRPSLSTALLAVVLVTWLLTQVGGRTEAQVVGPPGEGDARIIAALLEGWSQQNPAGSFPRDMSGPGLVRQTTPAEGTLLTRGPTAEKFLYDGNLNVVNLGDSYVEFGLSDGTVLAVVPPGGSTAVRPFVAFPPNEVVYRSRDGQRTEFVWVIRPN